MRCISPITLRKKVNGKIYVDKGYITVPCGQCFACRVNKTQEWTFRLACELTSWDSASFITLTYDDDNLPSGNGLDYRDLQLFIKRLRKAYDRPIKYYAVGEYGDNESGIDYGNDNGFGGFLGRPHFHLIVFGLPPDNNCRELLCRLWKYCDRERFLYNSKGVADVAIDSIAYVAGYCQKKLTGQLGKDIYERQGLSSPQSRCSRGLGLKAVINNLSQIKSNGCIFWNGTRIPVPKYFRDKLNLKAYPDKGYIKDVAEIVFGREYNEKDTFYYYELWSKGILQASLEKKLSSTNEQRRLDHLVAVRAKKSLMASKSYTNRSFD